MSTSHAPAWTAQQLQAIEHRSGDLLVSAAAGSGKTAVLAERCARLVCEDAPGQCNVENLLVLTFTDAAAHEMRERIGAAIRRYIVNTDSNDPRLRALLRQEAMLDRAAISTLHAFCARVLRQHFNEVGIDPTFTLLDEEEARLLQEQTLQELLEEAYRGEDVDAATRFKALFEAYASGDEGEFKYLILRLHRMMESSHDPAEWAARAEAAYQGAHADETVQRYWRETAPRELRMLAAQAKRMLSDIDAAYDGAIASPIYAGVNEARGRIESAADDLQQNGATACDDAREGLQQKWPTLRTPKDASGFEQLKERTWEKLKKKMGKLAEQLFALPAMLLRDDLAKLLPLVETLLHAARRFQEQYTAAKRGRNQLDFADLERLTLRLLTDPHAAAPGELRARFRYILVDEFQDINPLQHALLMALRTPPVLEDFTGNAGADGSGNLFMVGDVKQSIYGFRLAEPGLFLERESKARAAEIGLLPLPHNFRTHPHRLNLLNALFETILTPAVAEIDYRQQGHALQPPPKAEGESALDHELPPAELLLVLTKDPAEKPEGADSGDGDQSAGEMASAIESEARMVATRLRELLDAKTPIRVKSGDIEPLKSRHIAILLRGVRTAGPVFVQALAREGIPAHATLTTGYFDAPEVAHTLAVLETIDNSQQDILLATALLGPFGGGFSHDDLARIRLTYDRQSVTFSQATERYARDAAIADRARITDLAPDPFPFDPELARRLKAFFDRLSQWRDWVRTRPLHEALASIYADSRIFAYLAALGDDSKVAAGETPSATSNQRIANLQSLHGRALAFSSFSKQGLHRFLRFIDKLRDNEQDYGEAPILSEADDVVRILTVHKSKGLEFPLVVAAGLGMRINRDRGRVKFDRHFGIGMKVVDLDRHINYPSVMSLEVDQRQNRIRQAEELRLLYVAFTRAREQLIFSGSIASVDKLFAIRDEWEAYKRFSPKPHALPEDVLLSAQKPLDWLLPAITLSNLRVAWPEVETGQPRPESITAADLAIALHPPAVLGTNADANPWNDENVRRFFGTAENAITPSMEVEQSLRTLIDRVTWHYPHEKTAVGKAVRTVSELKSIVPPVPSSDDENALEEPDVDATLFPRKPTLFSRQPATPAAEEAKARGIATHRLLELMDFSGASDVQEQAETLVAAKRMTLEDRTRADLASIAWFLTDTASGTRVRQSLPTHLFREIPFTLAMSIHQPAPRMEEGPLFARFDEASEPTDLHDAPTIRGTIDLLLVDMVNRHAEIIDFKTDRAPKAEVIEAYERQMGYYMRAATTILGFPVHQATLVFLSTRKEHVVMHKF